VRDKTLAVLGALGLDAANDQSSAFDAAYRYCADLGIDMQFTNYR